jgi:hypothetical protein
MTISVSASVLSNAGRRRRFVLEQSYDINIKPAGSDVVANADTLNAFHVLRLANTA